VSPSRTTRAVTLRREGKAWVGRCPFHNGVAVTLSLTSKEVECSVCQARGRVVALSELAGDEMLARVTRLRKGEQA
jgi:hypothetical protein